MTSRRVPVVEDDRTISDALVERFRAEGYDVTQAFDGPSAVEQARALTPDVIVLDVMLPGFDGHGVCRRVQAERPVPVLMLTARDDEADNMYQEACGFTTLRLTVDGLEGWLGGLVVALMATGAVGLGRWLPRIALLTGGVALIGLAAVNPDPCEPVYAELEPTGATTG